MRTTQSIQSLVSALTKTKPTQMVTCTYLRKTPLID